MRIRLRQIDVLSEGVLRSSSKRVIPIVASNNNLLVPAPDERLTTTWECLRGCRTRVRFTFHYDDHHANTLRTEPAASKFKRRHWLTTRLGRVTCQAEKTTGCGSV